MFVGHYGPAFAMKGAQKNIPLWVLFIAVQWMDVVWSALVSLGVERFRIVPGYTASNSIDLYYMPYTHSLPGSLALSIIFGAIVAAFFRQDRARVFLIVALAVFSHWILDLIVHVPDLPLWDNSHKVGLGLWNYRWAELALEFGILIAGAAYYARAVPSAQPRGNLALWIFVLVLIVIHILSGLAPATAGGTAGFAAAAFTLYAVLALGAAALGAARK